MRKITKAVQTLALSAIILVGVSIPALAGSWQQRGDNIVYLTGNVGIGTESPGEMLTLNGSGVYDVGIAQELFGGKATMEFTTSDSSKKQASRIVLRGSTDWADIEFLSGARGSEVVNMLIKGTNGNVGIKTKNPLSDLHVFKNIFIGVPGDGGWVETDYQDGGKVLVIGDHDDVTSLRFRQDAFGKDAVISGLDGKVGVNTINPRRQLHLEGDFLINGKIISDGDICIGNC